MLTQAEKGRVFRALHERDGLSSEQRQRAPWPDTSGSCQYRRKTLVGADKFRPPFLRL